MEPSWIREPWKLEKLTFTPLWYHSTKGSGFPSARQFMVTGWSRRTTVSEGCSIIRGPNSLKRDFIPRREEKLFNIIWANNGANTAFSYCKQAPRGHTEHHNFYEKWTCHWNLLFISINRAWVTSPNHVSRTFLPWTKNGALQLFQPKQLFNHIVDVSCC